MADNKLKSVDTAFRIIEHLKSEDGATISEIVSSFDISKSTAYRYLTTLKSHGYVVNEDRDYHVGLRFVEMSHYAKHRKPAYEIAQQTTSTLATETADRASFITNENGLGVVLASEVGEHGIFADTHIGQRFYLHASAVGKALLALLPASEVEEIIDQYGLPVLTESTITNRDALFAELDEIRERGFAINNSERIDGIRAVAVGITDADDQVIGAFGVSGPTRRMSDERIQNELPQTLLSLAEEFELRIRYSEPFDSVT
ncbi:IclR family transcriptional regulator [Halobellus captivus]|uniref:IclR family transcriptional regulator n=1 Tax=Halobellus captivus TaxID=2592614 RepID=UPI00119DDC4D|nr:IclR family transcriptional regulator [Halobellus captivus]